MSNRIISKRTRPRRTLRPGEQIVNGRVLYSAAWLDETPLQRVPPRSPVEKRRSKRVLGWSLLRRCGLCGRIGWGGFERSPTTGRWTCADRGACASRRMGR